MPTRIAISPAANRMLPHQSIRARLRIPMSWSMKYAHTVPNSPTGAETRNTRCQLTGARSPPSSSPMNEPAMAAIELMPSAVPRWVAGNASVRMAGGLENRNRPADPLHDPPQDQPQRRRRAVLPGDGQEERADREDREAHV